MKVYKLYNKLLDKISPETESLVPGFSSKDGSAPVPIPHTTHFFYSKQPMIEIEEVDDVDSDIEI